jgi:hypothetical protein
MQIALDNERLRNPLIYVQVPYITRAVQFRYAPDSNAVYDLSFTEVVPSDIGFKRPLRFNKVILKDLVQRPT